MRRSSLLTFVAILVALVLAAPALSWTWPANGQVVRAFSLGDNPYAGGQHRGIDIAGEAGSDVRAPATGTVSFAGKVPNNGPTVTIQTADGYAVTLVGRGSIAVSKGATVSEGQKVGTIAPAPADGSPANVHLGIRIASNPNGYIDPQTLLPVREQTPLPGDQVAGTETATGAGEDPLEVGDGTYVTPVEQPVESGGEATETGSSTSVAVEQPVGIAVGVVVETPLVTTAPSDDAVTEPGGDQASADDDQVSTASVTSEQAPAPTPQETPEPQPATVGGDTGAATAPTESESSQPIATAPADQSPDSGATSAPAESESSQPIATAPADQGPNPGANSDESVPFVSTEVSAETPFVIGISALERAEAAPSAATARTSQTSASDGAGQTSAAPTTVQKSG